MRKRAEWFGRPAQILAVAAVIAIIGLLALQAPQAQAAVGNGTTNVPGVLFDGVITPSSNYTDVYSRVGTEELGTIAVSVGTVDDTGIQLLTRTGAVSIAKILFDQHAVKYGREDGQTGCLSAFVNANKDKSYYFITKSGQKEIRMGDISHEGPTFSNVKSFQNGCSFSGFTGSSVTANRIYDCRCNRNFGVFKEIIDNREPFRFVIADSGQTIPYDLQAPLGISFPRAPVKDIPVTVYLRDPAGPTNVRWQWYHPNDLGSPGAAIPGATSSIYTPVASDVGKTLIAQVGYDVPAYWDSTKVQRKYKWKRLESEVEEIRVTLDRVPVVGQTVTAGLHDPHGDVNMSSSDSISNWEWKKGTTTLVSTQSYTVAAGDAGAKDISVSADVKIRDLTAAITITRAWPYAVQTAAAANVPKIENCEVKVVATGSGRNQSYEVSLENCGSSGSFLEPSGKKSTVLVMRRYDSCDGAFANAGYLYSELRLRPGSTDGDYDLYQAGTDQKRNTFKRSDDGIDWRFWVEDIWAPSPSEMHGVIDSRANLQDPDNHDWYWPDWRVFWENYDAEICGKVGEPTITSDHSRVELPIPQDLSFVIHSDKVELAWDAFEDVADRVTGYLIFRKGPGDSTLKSYADVTGKDTKVYADTDIEPDTTSATVTTQPQLPPLDGEQVILDDDLPQPQNLSFLVYSDRIELSWDAIGEEQVTGYRVLRKGPDDAELQTLADLTGNDAAAYVDRSVEPGSTYEYAVAALDADSFPGEPSASVSATPPPLLTAEFLEAPESHDEESSFTFELRFSEEFVLSYKTLRDHAFEATGGRVAGARRLEPPGNVRWEIAVEPSGKGDVTVVLPVTGDCESDGAVCTDDGRPLSNRLELTVSGPVEEEQQNTEPGNSPATGAPTVTGTAQVGETLTAGTSGIADPDGLTNASYSYQWLADDADISGATGASYTLAAADEGKAVKVRVSFTDDAGNTESLTSAATDAVASLPRPPLTASLENAPGSHDGVNTFTFELRFSEEFRLSYKTLRDHAFTVAGGSVEGARRIDRDSDTPNIRWEITVRPDGDGEVVVTLPVTTDCADDGAICTEDGRMLSNELVLTVSGPGQ